MNNTVNIKQYGIYNSTLYKHTYLLISNKSVNVENKLTVNKKDSKEYVLGKLWTS